MGPSAIAERLGVRFGLFRRGRTWAGRLGDVALQVEAGHGSEVDLTFRHDRLDRGLWIGDPGAPLLEPRLRTGDPAFEAVLRVGSRDPWALGRFDAPMRARLAALIRPGDRCSGLSLHLRRAAREVDAEPGARLVSEAAALVARLSAPLDPLDAALALRGDPVPGTRAVADRLLVRRLAELPDLLAPVLATSASPDVRLAVGLHQQDDALLLELVGERGPVGLDAALAIAGRARGGAVEDALLARLGDADPRVVDALGRAGTVRAVGPLRRLDSVWSPLRARARAAVAEIQGRIGPLSGALSIAAAPGGDVSFADPEAGGALSPGRSHPGGAEEP